MMNEIKNEIMRRDNITMTENGALAYKSTGKDLVDIQFKLPSLRKCVGVETYNKFEKALNEDVDTAVRFLFCIRDIRGGYGERDVFHKLFEHFYMVKTKEAIACLSLVSEYGRWKDVVDIAFNTTFTELKSECFKLIETQLKEDVINCTNGKSISLLAKWMPSVNASQSARVRAIEFITFLKMNMGSYRKMLSKLRKYLDVTEVKTCGNKWNEIDYNKVSSNANLRYSDSFLKHDEIRRREYLAELSKPNSTVKMNAQVLNPHEIWHKYTGGSYYGRILVNDGYEAMWNNLKDMGDCGSTMVVVDGSGSMTCHIPNSSTMAIDVSRSLGVYFAERCKGEFHNKMIEFSSRPKFIDIDGKETLAEKISYMHQFNDCSNTDIEAVFNLILSTAIQNKMSQDDMPDRILIVSDMEFDCATGGYYRDIHYETLFETINKKFENAGYKMPRLVFWNVNSRTNAIPVTENEAGVALISGFSVNLMKMVMSNQTEPWLILKEMLDSERYNPVSEVLKNVNNE